MKEFCKDSPNVIGKDLISPLFVWWVYLLIAIVLAVNILIIYILIRKVKPYMYYVFNIGLYVFVMVVFLVSHHVIGNMQTMLVDTKTTLAIRDFLNLARLFQTVSVIFYFIRATGFDIKKFDFVRDLHGMDISEEDSEEIEVSVEFEGNVFIRNLKRKIREFKYYYRENKLIIVIGSLLFIGLIFFFIYSSFNKYDKVYKENQFFNIDVYSIGVKNSSILTTDFMGNKIVDDDSVLVVVNSSINGREYLSTSNFLLVVGGVQYYSISGYDSSLSDLGSVYTNQEITSDFNDYLFVYKIPKSSIDSDMIFRCVDSIVYKRGKTVINSIDVKLSPVKYDLFESKNYYYSLGNDINTGKYSINISDFDISDSYVINYNSCIVSGECYDFKEILRPSLIRNKDKVLLKLVGSAKDGDSSSNLFNLINSFGSIDYIYDGKSYSEYSDFNVVVSTKSKDNNVYYIEVDKEVMNSSNIKLSFNFRDSKYSYVLRGDINE
jgi:hypothetical protein